MTSSNDVIYNYIIQAFFAYLHCAAGGHFVLTEGTLSAPRLTFNYMVNNISEYVFHTVIIDITWKITKIFKFSIFGA